MMRAQHPLRTVLAAVEICIRRTVIQKLSDCLESIYKKKEKELFGYSLLCWKGTCNLPSFGLFSFG
uniref:Uncharacterized protein n=1 Tax=Romanomermis culicivorax TaxID=13658 RepID=A0A915KAQ8_ROMCU